MEREVEPRRQNISPMRKRMKEDDQISARSKRAERGSRQGSRASSPRKRKEVNQGPKKKVHFRDEEHGSELCDIHFVPSYKKYYNSVSDASCSCTCLLY